MASEYSQIFTLKDIFQNERLKNKLPHIKNNGQKNTQSGQNISLETVTNQIFDTATNIAKPYYKPIITERAGNTLIISGELVGDHDSAVEAICSALNGQKQILTWTANSAEMLKSAMEESDRNKRKYGINSKLYLRVQSMQQIEGMSKRQLEALMNNIMENIYYGDNFPETQKKFGVDKIAVNSPLDYNQRKLRWKFRVGDV